MKKTGNEIKGEILMLNPTDRVMDKDTITIYNVETKETVNFGERFCHWPVFNSEKNKVLSVINNSMIVEYDCTNYSNMDIYQGTVIEYAYYVPEKNAISFIQENKLYIYDRNINEISYLIDADNGYSWNKGGDKILYCKNNKIYIYDFTTKNSKYFADGSNPQYSNNNQFVCYKQQYNGSKQMLVVKDIINNKQWHYKTNGIASFRFSPNDKFIALEESKTRGFFTKWDLVVWDFQNNKKTPLIKNVVNPSLSIDWK